MPTTPTSTRRASRALALLLAVGLVGSCSSDDDEPTPAAATEGEAEEASQDPFVTDSWYEGADLGTGTDAPQGPLGSENPEITGDFPEEIPTTPFPTVEPGHVVVVEDYGVGQGAAHLVDPVDGSLGYLNVATGADIWMPTGGDALPLAVASVEGYRPRGARGTLQSVVTFWNPEGDVRGEVILPRNQYPGAGAQHPQMTPDGRYVVVNDRRLPGFLLIDVEEEEVVAELTLEPTCLPRLHLADADTAYAVCWESGEVVELAIGDGTLEEVGRAEAFEPGSQVLEEALFSRASGTLLVFTRYSEVLPVDLSGGLPDAPVEPVALVEPGHAVRGGWNVLTPDGTRAVVAYVEGEDYGSGDPALWRVLDTSTWAETGRLAFPTEPAAVAPTPDSTGVYVLTNEVEVPAEDGEPGETEEVTTLSVVDLTGAEVSSTQVEPTTGSKSFTKLYLPVVVEPGA